MRVAIVGSGVSGLGALWKSMNTVIDRKANAEFVLFESGSAKGGCLSNVQKGQYLLEHGAQGVLLSREPFLRWVEKLGIKDQMIVPQGKQIRYVIRNNRLVKVSPFSLMNSQMLGLSGCLRALKEIFVEKNANEEESISDFFSRRFGPPVAECLAVPMATGIWGGASKEILLKYGFPSLHNLEMEYGSVVKGIFKKSIKKTKGDKTQKGLGSFKGGMGVFADALRDASEHLAKANGIGLRSVHGFAVQELTYHKDSLKFTLNGSHQDGPSTDFVFDKVVWAVPPWRSQAQFLGGISSETVKESWKELTQAYTHHFVVVGVGGKGVGQPGFGAVCDASSQDLLGILFVHSIYPEHCPPGHFLYRMMFGGDRDANFINLSDSEIQKKALSHLKNLGLVSGGFQPDFFSIQRWPGAIAPPTKQIINHQKAIESLEGAMPGLAMCGNYIRGVGVADCLLTAEEAVEKLWGPSLF